MFKPHYYLDIPNPIAAAYFIGTVDGEPVCHLAITPRFEIPAYRATRLVVMPEWQGAGVGLRFLNYICELHKNGGGLGGRRLPTYFHTSHPQLCGALRASAAWSQCSAALWGGDRQKSQKTISKSGNNAGIGYGGHLRAIQGFKYIGQ